MPELGDILELWHGTPDSTGYLSEELVVAACRLEPPVGVLACLAMFYPGVDSALIDPDARETVGRGFELWQRRASLERRSGIVKRALGR